MVPFDVYIHVPARLEAQLGLIKEAYIRVRRIALLLAQEGQVRLSVAVEVPGSHGDAGRGRQQSASLLAEPVRRAVVDVSVQPGVRPVGEHAENEVVVPVPVKVRQGARPGPVGRHFVPRGAAQRVLVHIRGRILAVIVVVGENQVEVAVLVEVVLVDALQHPCPRHIQVVARVAERALSKPESTEGGRLVSILKWPEGAPLNLG